MSESSYRKGRREGLEEGLRRSKDWFWCGVCVALATWPLTGIAYLAWRVFR